ncbi:unnamed protein product [Prunus armeniaca]|uniref:Uncharacterized protein n=1 Tax=Prunus armeniaca TaxID=36596 RepID=A0A6J5XRC7_PRUAR|nr:unnamed protein product [Prunus armeniaca]
MEVRVRFVGFGAKEDGWVNVGDLVLCFQLWILFAPFRCINKLFFKPLSQASFLKIDNFTSQEGTRLLILLQGRGMQQHGKCARRQS